MRSSAGPKPTARRPVHLLGVARVGVHQDELADVVQQRGDEQAVAVAVAGRGGEPVGGALDGDGVEAEALRRGVPGLPALEELEGLGGGDEALENVPALAESRKRVLRVVTQDQPSVADMVTAIESDVALVIAVMRLANAADSALRRGLLFDLPGGLLSGRITCPSRRHRPRLPCTGTGHIDHVTYRQDSDKS